MHFTCAECKKENVCYQGKSCYDQGMVRPEYEDEENLKILKIASRLEAEYYMQLNRLQELIRFAKEMEYKRLGLAFCVGLAKEARILSEILRKDFVVDSIICKVGGVDKKTFSLPNIRDDRYEACCNPIGQAKYLAEAGTDLNIIVGLCVGHDILFTKYSQAPVTTLVVKDRVLAHNPLGAIYSNYWLKKF